MDQFFQAIFDAIVEFFRRLWAVIRLPFDYFQAGQTVQGITAIVLVVLLLMLILWGWRVRHARGHIRA